MKSVLAIFDHFCYAVIWIIKIKTIGNIHLKKKLFIKFCLLFLAISPLATSEVEDTISNSKEIKEAEETKVNASKTWEADLIKPYHEKSRIPPYQLSLIDFIAPGFGMFYLEKYYWAGGYALLKIMGGVAIFFAYQNYSFWNSTLNSSTVQQSQGTNNLIEVREKSESLTYQSIKQNAETAFLWFLYSVITQAVIYGISFWHTWFEANKIYENSRPFYQIDLEQKKDYSNQFNFKVKFGYQKRF